jgi:hypothetical protein
MSGRHGRSRKRDRARAEGRALTWKARLLCAVVQAAAAGVVRAVAHRLWEAFSHLW